MSAVAKRYARAAVAAVEETGGSIDALSRGLFDFASAYDASDELREVLVNPALHDYRTQVLEAVFKQLEAPQTVANLVRLLADNHRLDVLRDIAREVEGIADARADRLRAEVVSAIELNDEQRDRITRALETRFGRKVAVRVSVDPEILGGLVCHVGDVTLDSSLRRQLERLHEQLEASR